MLTDDGARRGLAARRAGACLVVILACWAGGCSSGGPYASTGLLGGLRRDPNVRYVAYSRGGDRDVFGHRPGMGDAIAARVKKFWAGPGVGVRLREFMLKRKNGLP